MSKTLALGSLEIRNFRGLRELRIERLGRVNLITGRNNVGKTSVLEALRLFARPGSVNALIEILGAREEVDPSSIGAKTGDESNSLSVEGLFSRDQFERGEPPTIRIGPITPEFSTLSISLKSHLELDAGYYEMEGWMNWAADDSIPRRRFLLFKQGDSELVLKIDNTQRFAMVRTGNRLPDQTASSQFVGPNGLDSAQLLRLWDGMTLTPLEDDVIAALKVIHPGIDRLNFRYLDTISRIRVPFVKIHGQDAPVPLRTMGDGMNRIFGIAQSLASAAGGLMLVVEIENGIHYTVLEGLWKLIFRVAARLDVQVFATSHSWDCVEAFQAAARESPAEGMLIRLARKGDRILVGEFDERVLGIAVEGRIEVR